MIELYNVSHTFPNGFKSLHNINLKLHKNEFTVLSGENGSGKTVLSFLLNGLYSPSSGKILFDNIDINEQLLEIRKKIGLIFQDSDTQIVGQTVYDDVAFGLENLNFPRGEIDKTVRESLKLLGLESYENRVPSQLSGGEKKRLAIAGILAMQPDYIILDEPFNCLDYPGVRQVLDKLVRLKEMGKSILVITHDLEKVLAHADRLIILQKGCIIRDISAKCYDLKDKLNNCNIKIPQCKVSEMTWL